MTLADLIAQFRAESLDLATPPLSSDEQVTGWLNEAVDEACIRARLIFDNSATRCRFAVAAGDMTVTLHASVLTVDYATLTDAAGAVAQINPTDRIEMDRLRSDWRTLARKPDGFIHDDKTLMLNAPADAAYTLNIETHRLPLAPMSADPSAPEISAIHHRHLVNWALYRHYSKPDAETIDKGKATDSEARFEKYFGPRPNASIRRKQLANRPHHNKPCW